MCVSLLAPEYAVCVCMWYQIRVAVKNHVMCQTSVNLMPCCSIYNIYILLLYRGYIYICGGGGDLEVGGGGLDKMWKGGLGTIG